MKNLVLLVDDNSINRAILRKILSVDYNTMEAENGEIALRLLQEQPDSFAAVILDLKMPVMDGFDVLRVVSGEEALQNIPIIIATGNSDNLNETEALKLGAWDFISKPYVPDILKFRLKNAIERSKLNLFEQLKHQAEHDELTGLYNSKKFYQAVTTVLHTHPADSFAMIRFDIDRFKQFNSLFGTDAGDALLCFIADLMQRAVPADRACVYSRIGTDVFAVCVQYTEQEEVLEQVRHLQQHVSAYNEQFNLVVPFGVYFIDDNTLSPNEMLDRATIAAKTRKGKYISNIAIYTNEMGESIRLEQDITNEMNAALEEEQFCVYYQPKYNIATGEPIGAEALVRWKHPEKGMISPGVFIPVFEKNGFVSQVDYYVWKKTCAYLRSWIDSGLTPRPISVNISRANLNNPKIVSLITELVQQYDLDPKLLELEITESAYMDNPEIMKHIVNDFHENGFVVLMDDFGSGYSSLNTLKDVAVDILKIDMKFLPTSDTNPKTEKILASIIRMAEWIGMPTIVEGVESREQRDYLKSIGCIYVQGFYYGRPMPVEDYHALMVSAQNNAADHPTSVSDAQFDALLSADPKTEAVLSGLSVPVAIYEYGEGRLDRIRVNQSFYDVFGYKARTDDNSPYLEQSQYEQLCAVIQHVAMSGTSAECEIYADNNVGVRAWFRVHLRYVMADKTGKVICAVFTNITPEKLIEQEMKNMAAIMNQPPAEKRTMLVIDDTELSREMLKTMFEDEFRILEASDGEEALAILEQHADEICVILLDMIMPKMNGSAFLTEKNRHSALQHIPVVIISSDNATDMQINMLRMGVHDYITKPFIPELAIRRVHNVLEYQNRFAQLLGEYNSVIASDTHKQS